MALIGLISDLHAAPEPVAQALSIFKKAGVEQILCAGDIAGYMQQLSATVKLLEQGNCHTVIGNHDQSYLSKNPAGHEDANIHFLQQLPLFYQAVIDNTSVYMVHAQPPDGTHGGIKLLDKNGELLTEQVELWTEKLRSFDYDVLVIGHTHQVFAEVLSGTLVINPGSSLFNNCCAILRLPEQSVEMIALNGNNIEKTWNWGEHVIYRK